MLQENVIEMAGCDQSFFELASLADVCSVQTVIGLGGLHTAPEGYLLDRSQEHLLLDLERAADHVAPLYTLSVHEEILDVRAQQDVSE